MNLKTKAFGLIAALAMSLGLVGPALAADTNSATTNLNVGITDDGIFAISFDAASTNFSPVIADLTTATNVGGAIDVTYTDTKTYRSAFTVSFQASDFVSAVHVPYATAGTFYKITADNLTLAANYQGISIRWRNADYAYRVGGIGPLDSNGATHGSLGNTTPNPWTSANQLNTPKNVAYATAGSGTVATTQRFDLGLHVPEALPGGAYVSTLTATVTFGTP